MIPETDAEAVAQSLADALFDYHVGVVVEGREETGGFSPMWLGMYTFFVDHKTGDLVYRGFADWDHPCTPMTDEELAEIKSVDALAEETGVHDYGSWTSECN